MPEERGYWGIEIGQAGLKALRLQPVEGAGKAVATNFDYVPHAKILSQPDAVPEELINTAIDTFLSRNDLRGDSIAISVPGQSALARFIQLPPVEQSKVAQIVLYEAKQQIPFPLEDVIWDYQTLGGGTEESGFLLEAEVGLFAMKRDLVLQQLRPFADRKVEVDLIQVAPLSLFNFLCYDRLKIRPDEAFTPNDDHTVICEMGTDNTILVVTNGAKIWIRNVPIGGNHFTRALVKDMKLTFAKAEHLKNNATKSPDPKAVFQAMRPVFNDYVAEIQRSVGYFSSVNRSAKIVKVLGVGNGFKLAGLQKFLQQNLQYPVERVERFECLVGEKVLSDAVFQENILGFVVPYGLAVQGMGETTMRTSLLPPEIVTARKIRGKKPWVVLTAASLMGMFALSAGLQGGVYRSVSPELFGGAEQAVNSWNKDASDATSNYQKEVDAIAAINTKANGLIGDVSTRTLWLDLMRAVNESLPRDTAETVAADDITKRRRMRIHSMTTEKVSDPSVWFNSLPKAAKDYLAPYDAAAPSATPAETPTTDTTSSAAPSTPEFYVVTLVGEHYHRGGEDYHQYGVGYVQDTLLRNLQSWEVSQDGSGEVVPVGKIGISHAVIIQNDTVEAYDPRNFTEIDLGEENPFGRTGQNPGYPGAGAMGVEQPYSEMMMTQPMAGARGAGGSRGTGSTGRFGSTGAPRINIDQLTSRPQNVQSELKYPNISRTNFTVQFLWSPITPERRQETRPVATAEGTDPAAAGAEVPAGGEAADPAAATNTAPMETVPATGTAPMGTTPPAGTAPMGSAVPANPAAGGAGGTAPAAFGGATTPPAGASPATGAVPSTGTAPGAAVPPATPSADTPTTNAPVPEVPAGDAPPVDPSAPPEAPGLVEPPSDF